MAILRLDLILLIHGVGLQALLRQDLPLGLLERHLIVDLQVVLDLAPRVRVGAAQGRVRRDLWHARLQSGHTLTGHVMHGHVHLVDLLAVQAGLVVGDEGLVLLLLAKQLHLSLLELTQLLGLGQLQLRLLLLQELLVLQHLLVISCVQLLLLGQASFTLTTVYK